MSVAILYICTGNYQYFFEEFYNSCKEYFMPNIPKKFFVWTDSKDDKFFKSDVILINKEFIGWPYETLFRYKNFLTQKDSLMEFDFIFFFNANMKFVKVINQDFLNHISFSKIGALIHPGYFNKNNDSLPLEKNSNSTAYISDINLCKYYYQGCFFGGVTSNFIELCEFCDSNIDKDLSNGIIAIWHDETHLNKFLSLINHYSIPCDFGIPEKVYKNYKNGFIIQRDKEVLYGDVDLLRKNLDMKIIEYNKSFFTKKHPVKIIKKEFLIKNFYKCFDISIEEFLNEDVQVFKNIDNGLITFKPNISGSDQFYQKLSNNNWYYTKERWEFDHVLNCIEVNSSVLEVGCGYGYFLDKLKFKTNNFKGVELNPDAVAFCNAKGYNIIQDKIENINKDFENKFDNICVFQVLEHLEDPIPFIANMLDFLNPKGKLFISVPCQESIFFKNLFEIESVKNIDELKMLLLNLPPHHMSFWSKKSFQSLEKIFPLKVKKIKFQPVGNSSIGLVFNIVKFKIIKLFLLCFKNIVFSNSFIYKGHTILVEFEYLEK